MDTPRQFFDAYVNRSYEAWSNAPTDLMLASCAVHQANVMLERLVRDQNPTLPAKELSKLVTERRKKLAETNADFGLVRDIDDTHKHLELTRGKRPTSVQGGAWGNSWWGMWGESWGTREIVVPLNDGTQRPLDAILKNVIAM